VTDEPARPTQPPDLRTEVRSWLRSVLPPGWMEAVDSGDDEGFERVKGASGWDYMGWARTIGRSPYVAPLWPREHGGMGATPDQAVLIREELSRYRLPTLSPNLLGIFLAGPTIIEHGTRAQKDRYLRNILSGDEVWCQLFSEPGAGSDLASLATRAVRDGDQWVVNGQKVWTSRGHLADFGMLLARTDPDLPKHRGITYFILDMHAPGVEVRPLRQMNGEADFNEVFLTDVRVADADRVGDVGDGWRCALTTLANERTAISGASLDTISLEGGLRSDPWRSYLDAMPEDRSALDRQTLARIYIQMRVNELTGQRIDALRKPGDQPGAQGGITKILGAEFNQLRWAFNVDIQGMSGIAWAPGDRPAIDASAAFLRSRANSIEGGTSEILRNQVAERLLGLPRDPQNLRDTPWSELLRN